MATLSNSVLLGQVPLVQGIREAGDAGKPAIMQEDAVNKDYFMAIAKNAIREIAIRNETLAPTQSVNVNT